MPARAPGRPLAGYLLVAALTLFWGLNWPSMKVALQEVPVWPFRALCCGFAGIGMLLVARIGGHRLIPGRGELLPLAVCSAGNVTAWHLFTAYGLLEIGAGRASIIAFTMPLWLALLTILVLREPPSGRQLLALVLGLAGLAALTLPDLARLRAAPLGVLYILGAAIAWAIGTIVLKRTRWSMPTVSLTAWQLLAGGAPIILGTLLFHPPFDWTSLSPRGLAAVAFTLLLPMLICQWVWFKIVEIFPPSVAGLSTLAIPVVGVLSGALLLGEPVGLAEMAALALVLPALALVLLAPAGR